MRLSEYPYVVVRVGCSKCHRQGAYRLARLADRYGAETTLPHLIEALAADCELREAKRPNIYDRCGAFFPDLAGGRPPDLPCTATIRPKLRAVK